MHKWEVLDDCQHNVISYEDVTFSVIYLGKQDKLMIIVSVLSYLTSQDQFKTSKTY